MAYYFFSLVLRSSYTSMVYYSPNVRWYIKDLFVCTKMIDAKPIATSLTTSLILTLHSSTTLSDPTEFGAVVGSFQYLSLTWPNIAFTINRLSQFMHHPTINHWVVVKRLLHYLCGTLDHMLLLYCDFSISLHAFLDVD